MAELKQTMQVKIIDVTNINTKASPPNLWIGLPLKSSFLYWSKQPLYVFGLRHQFWLCFILSPSALLKVRMLVYDVIFSFWVLPVLINRPRWSPLYVQELWLIQGPPKRPDTFENLIEIKRVDENNWCLHFWKAYSMPFCAVSKKQSTMHLWRHNGWFLK